MFQRPSAPQARFRASARFSPLRVEDRFGLLGFGVDRAEAVHATLVVHPVHVTVWGVRANSTPIIELRVTNGSSCSAVQPSVPSGRIGITR